MTFWEVLAYMAPVIFLPWVIYTVLMFYSFKIETEDRFIKACLYLMYWLMLTASLFFLLFGVLDLDWEVGSLIVAIFNNVAAVLLPMIIYLVTKRGR